MPNELNKQKSKGIFYLLGDNYFKTKYPGHNVDRGRNQLALAKDVKQKFEKMEEILKKYL